MVSILPQSHTHKMDIFRFNTSKFTPVVSGLCCWLLDCTGLPQVFSSPRASGVLDRVILCCNHCVRNVWGPVVVLALNHRMWVFLQILVKNAFLILLINCTFSVQIIWVNHRRESMLNEDLRWDLSPVVYWSAVVSPLWVYGYNTLNCSNYGSRTCWIMNHIFHCCSDHRDCGWSFGYPIRRVLIFNGAVCEETSVGAFGATGT